VSNDRPRGERARAIAVAHPPSALSASFQARMRIMVALAFIVQFILNVLPSL
jgi:hypothetical protein